TNEHGQEMRRVVDEADEETVQQVLDQAESGELRNFLDGEYQSRGAIDILAYRDAFPTAPSEYLPGTSVRETVRPTGPPEIVSGVQDITLPVGTRSAWMPRGYLIPAEMTDLVENLEIQGVEVTPLEEPLTAEGEQFTVTRMRHEFRSGYAMTELDGDFIETVRDFPAGTFYVDMAQPLANLAFYYLEPQSRDGYVGWNVLDQTLIDLGVQERAIAYPIFKYRREVQDD
ncbi:MAG: hypothetical protein WD120_04310, partial [Gemmatimonadota bacterium]